MSIIDRISVISGSNVCPFGFRSANTAMCIEQSC